MSTNTLRGDIIFLLGAGASKNADIPISSEMLYNLEKSLSSNVEDESWLEIYHYVLGAISFAKGCRGSKGMGTTNIEDIMKTLRLLANRQYEDIYPFVGSWHEKISQFESKDSKCFKKLIEFIEEKFVEWVDLKDKEMKANYLQGFGKLAKDLSAKIRIFTLNYDLSIETAIDNYSRCSLQTGFDFEGNWNSAFYDESESDIYLYKLHGSIDWWYTDNGLIVRSEEPAGKKRLLIFGVDNKLQSIDPFFYQTYQMRQHILQTEVIIIIGYSFSDSYINRIIFQALQHDESKKLLIIDKYANRIKENLHSICLNDMDFELPENKVIPFQVETKPLFENDLLKPKLDEIYTKIEDELPFK